MATFGPNANGIEFTTTQTGTVPIVGTPLFTVNIIDTTTGTQLDSFTNVPGANIITTSGTTLNIASVANLSDYFIVPGVTANITFGASLASLPTIFVGGNATITSVGSVLSGAIIDVLGGTVTASSSLVGDALSGLTINLESGGEYSAGAGLISLLSGTTINFGTNGGTFVANAGGALLDLSGVTINGFNQASDQIEFQNLSAPLGSYSVTTAGGSQTIDLFSSTGTEIGTVTVAGASLSTGTFTAGQTGPLTVNETGSGGSFNITIDPGAGVVPCFLGGTLVATPEGGKRIEALSVGDLVLTDEGRAVPVRWIGRRTISTVFADPLRSLPVRIRAGALGELPCNDLLVSPDHALLVDGTLVNAGALVNGTTIVRETGLPRNFVYYHIETDEHALIMAEGVPAETFINHVDRMAFDNWMEHAEIFGDAPEKPEMAYPRVKSTRQLPHAIRQRLMAYAGDAGRAAA